MTDKLITGGATSLMLWELQKITKETNKTKDEHTLNFALIKPMKDFILIVLYLTQRKCVELDYLFIIQCLI